MTNRARIAIYAGLCLVCAFLAITRSGHERKLLEPWFAVGDAKTPIELYGTNILPTYISILRADPPRLRGLASHPNMPDFISRRFASAPDDESAKLAILQALSDLDGALATDAVASAVRFLGGASQQDPADARVYVETERLLSTVQSKTIMAELIAALESEDSLLRFNATRWLIPYGSEASNAVPSVLRLLEAKEPFAAPALAAISPDLPNLSAKIVQLAGSPKVQPITSRLAVLSLARLGTRASDSTADLLKLLDSARSQLAREPSAPGSSAQGDHERMFVALITALGAVGSPSSAALPRLREELKHANPMIRLFAARAIWQINSRSERRDESPIIEALSELLNQPLEISGFEFDFGSGFPDPLARLNWTDRMPAYHRTAELSCASLAAYLLGEMGAAARPSLRVLETCSRDEYSFEQLFVARAIAKITGENEPYFNLLVSALEWEISQEAVSLKVPAALFLGELGGDAKAALPKLESLRSDTDLGIRLAAEGAIARIRGSEEGQRRVE